MDKHLSFSRLLIFLFLTSLFLISSCGPSHEERTAEIDQLRTQAETLITIQSEMGWDNWVFGKQSNQDSLYKEHGGLFTVDNITLLRKTEEEEPDPIQRKRLHYFRRYLTTEYIAKSIAPLTDSVSNLEASLTVTIDGREVPYRQVNGMIAVETDQDARADMYRALDPALDSLNTILTRVEAMYQALSAALGYSSYNAMIHDLKGIDPEQFRVTCEEVLEKTEKSYLDLLKVQLAAFPGLSMEDFYRYDTGPLFRSARFSPFFPADAMLPTAGKTLAGMGIDLDALPNLHIDAEPREQKNPRAVCFPVSVPTDVRLS
ncbi:MAG: hypothetical protein OEV30_11815, partial [Ignavibacteria bacterium]|nr:hypothetical protein [Ignavibacteria bacterium]